MPKTAKKHANKKRLSSKKLSVYMHTAHIRKISSEKELHHMIRLLGVLFPLKEDKDIKQDLEYLSLMAHKKGFKSLYGLLQGLLAEEVSSARLEKASDTVLKIFKDESGVDLTTKKPKPIGTKKKTWFASL